MPSNTFKHVVYLCFFMSGAVGLIYEVIWARQLGLFLGITTYAHTAVITAFMAGLGLGSWLIGKQSDQLEHPLRFYAWLEIGIGLYAMSTPWLFPTLQVLYAGSSDIHNITTSSGHTVRFMIAIAALLLPTFLMGGTLPLLIRGMVKTLPDLASATGKLYGINTLGATLGTFATGFFLLPTLGIRGSIYVGVILNILVALLILLFDKKQPTQDIATTQAHSKRKIKKTTKKKQLESEQQNITEQNPISASLHRALLIGFIFAGFAAMLGQLAWIRSFILIVGSSVYAFTLTLTGFLAGLGIGSALYGYWVSKQSRTKHNQQLRLAIILFICIGFLFLLSVLTIHWAPEVYIAGYKLGLPQEFITHQGFLFLMVCFIVFLPALGMGSLFPLLAGLLTKTISKSGSGIGSAYAMNTFGTIVGTLLGGLFVIPAIGSQNTIYAAAIIYILLGIAVYLVEAQKKIDRVIIGRVALVLISFSIVVFSLPNWRQSLMASGVFYSIDRYAKERSSGKTLDELSRKDKLLYYNEGIDTIVSVFESKRQKYLKVNGKTDASSRGDMPTQVLLGQLPLLIHESPKRVLIIGLGSGVTAAAVASHPEVEDITILEISQSVVEASKFFLDVNHRVLSDPRVKLHIGDARNFLLADYSVYDIIITEPSNPWVSGVSNLFTQDFFELARKRLNHDGLMTQWLHFYGMALPDFKSLLHSYQSVFDHLSLWSPLSGDAIVIGSKREHELRYQNLTQTFLNRTQVKQLKNIDIIQPRDIVRKFLATSTQAKDFSSSAPFNTDDQPRIEFNAPKQYFESTVNQNLNAIIKQQQGAYFRVPIDSGINEISDAVNIPAMGIRISSPLSHMGNANFEWRIKQVYLSTEENKSTKHLASGTERVLTWADSHDNTLNRLQSFHVPVQLPKDALQQHLESLFGTITHQRGEFTLASNNKGWWGRQEQVDGKSLIALVWLCPTIRGVTRQTLLSQYSDTQPLEKQLPAVLEKYICL